MPDDVTEENPLEFFTDEELFRELASRCVHAVFAYEKDMTETESDVSFRFKGGVMGAIGLCRFTESKLLSEGFSGHTDDID